MKEVVLGIIFAYNSFWSNIFLHPCFKTCQGMLRSLYFTWDQLTGPYLNAHSLLGCSTGALGNFERRGRSWFFLWPFLVEVGRSLGNDISFKTEPQSNQVDSHWSISSIKSLLQCHHNTNQNYNIGEMFRNHGFGSTIGYCVDLLNDFFFKTKRGPKWCPWSSRGSIKIPRLTSQLWPLQNLRRWLRNDELTGEFVRDRFWKSMRRVSHGQKVQIENHNVGSWLVQQTRVLRIRFNTCFTFDA